MDPLLLVPAIFILLELSNVTALCLWPGTKLANGVGVFRAWEKSKADPEVHDFVRYLVYWVASTKLIFLGLLTTVLVMGSTELKRVALFVLVGAICVFYLRLFPLVRRIDARGELDPAGYSKVLGGLIALFALMLGTAGYLLE